MNSTDENKENEKTDPMPSTSSNIDSTKNVPGTSTGSTKGTTKNNGNGATNSTLGLMSLNDNKAGMVGLDKEKINAIIENASKGSKFYAKQQENQARIDGQIKSLQARHKSLSSKELLIARHEADSYIDYLKQSLDLSRTIVHVDMDMFYAAVEMRDNPDLRDKPMAVGGIGMLSTSNYAARKFGVRAAMPGFIGKKLCPDLVIVPGNMKKYAQESEVIRQVFSEYDENFAPMSLDEAYMDITDYLQLNPDNNPADSVQEMREKIEERTKLTASAGIAPNTFLAKVCSDLNKPNGQYILEPDQNTILDFVKNLAIRKAPGIGNVQEQLLRSIGVKTCGDLFEYRAEIKLLFSQISFEHYMQVSQGIGSTRLEPPEDRVRKSISTETTFRETSDRTKLLELCDELSDELSETMQAKQIYGQAVAIKIKSHDFKLKTKVRQIASATNAADVIKSVARQLIQQLLDSSEQQPLALRLLGVRMSELKNKEEVGSTKQKSIFSFLVNGTTATQAAKSEDLVQNATADGANLKIKDAEKSKREEESTKDLKLKWPHQKSNSKLKKSEPEFECPVCGHMVRGLNNLNSHVDKCLEKSHQEQQLQVTNSESQNVTDHESQSVTDFESKQIPESSHLPQLFDDREEFNTYDSDSNEDFTEIITYDSDDDFATAADDKAKKQPENISNTKKVTCPVCFKATFDSEVELNRHIDVCLNSEVIDSVTKEDENNRQKASSSISATFGEGSRKRKSASSHQSTASGSSCADSANCQGSSSKKKAKLSINKIDSYFRKS